MASPSISLSFVGLPVPYRRGIERAAEDSGMVSTVGTEVVLVPLERRDESCDRVTELVAVGGRVVCLLQPFDVPGVAHAISHGAFFAPYDAEPAQVLSAAFASVEGAVHLPFDVAAAMIGGDVHASVELSDEESSWLVALAGGATVVKVADQFGYSERVLFRRLHDLYGRLGVSNRAEALVAAERRRLLRAPGGSG